MSKLFIQTLPTPEQLQASLPQIYEDIDIKAIYLNMLFTKIANDLDNHLESLLAPHGLSSGRFTILCILEGKPQGFMPSELSQEVGVTQATISGLINGLEKAGLVKRQTHEKDGRSFVVKITEKGTSVVKEIFPQWAPKISAFWNQIGDDEQASMGRVLEKMTKSTSILNS